MSHFLRYIFIVVLFCGTTLYIQAQRVCGTETYLKTIAADPSIKHTAARATTAARDVTDDEIINIPVVVHVLYNRDEQNISDAQINSQIDALNKDFRMQNADGANTPSAFKPFAADAKIMFCLAKVDPQNRSTTGIIRKQTTKDVFFADDAMKFTAQGGDNAWDNTKYLNIWVCNMGGRTLGYATPPGTSADRDGVTIACDVFGTTGYIRAPFNKGRTATHEIGHWFGLSHIWGDTNCGDDGIDDTPRQRSYNYGCPSFPNVTTCSPDANGDMFMDFMDFTDDACMNMFTKGQVKKMRSLFSKTGVRNSFLASFACDPSYAQGGPLPVDEEPVVTPKPVINPATIRVKIFPNPVHTIASVEPATVDVSLAGKTLHVYNEVGAEVFKGILSASKNIINLSGYSKGIYLVRVGEGKDASVTKVLHP